MHLHPADRDMHIRRVHLRTNLPLRESLRWGLPGKLAFDLRQLLIPPGVGLDRRSGLQSGWFRYGRCRRERSCRLRPALRQPAIVLGLRLSSGGRRGSAVGPMLRQSSTQRHGRAVRWVLWSALRQCRLRHAWSK
jgi:hypothetical protein